MPDLSGKVAVVTGASRGVGRGVALGLAEAGAIVYATGRSISKEAFATDRIIPVRCDHTNDREVEAAFQRIFDEQERLDILVNNVWGGYAGMVESGEFTWPRPFWEQPL
jgi:NAD(P)-dependent dehydrogenase (short-subunit alcohol dehydrogenase family)